MFGVGLHFSLKDLMEVRRISLPGAVAQIVAATGLGAGLAHLWGWSLESGMMFGLALSVASTVVLLRALEENNMLQTLNGRIAIGWLIVEDLAMVLALVLIPALAGSGQELSHGSPLAELFIAVGKVVLFIAIMLVAGRKALPWLLTYVMKTGSRELFTLAVFAMAMGIAFSAAKLFSVSFALGAFFAGMMIRESDLNHEVADRALPFQEAFAVLFFVVVGMLFNPAVLWNEPMKVAAVVAVIMVGKSLAGALIVILFRYPLKTALFVSAGLAQIGEFSFVLINVGLAHGLLPPEGRDLILAGALIAIALNPLAFQGSRMVFQMVGRKPRLAAVFDMRDDDLSRLRGDKLRSLRDPIILVGSGRVGGPLTQNIRTIYDLVVIDSNREVVETLRREGYHAIAGDGGQVETLHAAGIDKAVAIIITVPDSFEARRIVQTARHIRPSIKVLVRAHNEEEIAHFEHESIDLILSGPEEIRRRMEEYLRELKST